VPLYYPELYAGTTDCVGVHDGDESILDFKQSKKPKKIQNNKNGKTTEQKTKAQTVELVSKMRK
jgi:hypothetical protein